MKTKFLVILLFVISSSNAQNTGAVTEEIKGMPSGQTLTNRQNILLRLNEKEFVYAASKVDGIEATLIKINNSPEKLWESANIKGYLFTSRFHDNIIVFSSPEMKKPASMIFTGGDHLKTIHVTILDSKTGKIILEKDALHTNDIDRTDLSLLNDSMGNFKYLIVEASHYEGKTFHVGLAKIPKKIIDFFELVSLTDAAEAGNSFKIEAAKFENGKYIGALCDDQANVYMTFLFNGAIAINKYSDKGAMIATLKTKPFFNNENAWTDGNSVLKLKGNDIYFGASIKQQHEDALSVICHFDFTAKQVYFKQTILDKEYFKATGIKMGLTTSQSTTDLFFYGENLIVIKEIMVIKAGERYSHYSFGPIFISLYDKTMKLIKEIPVAEDFNSYLNFGGFSGETLVDDKLLFVYCGAHNLKIKTMFSVIDLENFIVKETKVINTTGADMSMFGPAASWNKSSVILPYLKQNSAFASGKQNTIWQRFDF